MKAVAKAVILYLAPLLALTSFLLNLFVFLAPVLIFHDNVSLARIYPAVVDATSHTTKAGSVDGPSVLVGLLGSCARRSSKEALFCSSPSFSAKYNLTVLPHSIPNFLTAPVPATPAFAMIALGIFAAFLPAFTLSALREKLPGKLGGVFNKPMVGSWIAWMGVLSWMVLMTVYLVMRMWLGRAVGDTQMQIENLGKDAPQLAVEIANGFILIWVAQAFAVVPIICSLMKLSMSGGKSV